MLSPSDWGLYPNRAKKMSGYPKITGITIMPGIVAFIMRILKKSIQGSSGYHLSLLKAGGSDLVLT